MNKIKIKLGKLTASAFAGLLVGCLRAHGLTSDLRLEDDKHVIVSVWLVGGKHFALHINKQTKEVVCKGEFSAGRKLCRRDVEVILNTDSASSEVVAIISPETKSVAENDSETLYPEAVGFVR